MKIFSGQVINPVPPPPQGASWRARLLHAQQAAEAGYLPALEDIGRPLVIFLGGFLDASTLRLYNTVLEYKNGPWYADGSTTPPPAFFSERPFPWDENAMRAMGEAQDIYYRAHDTRAHIQLLMALYHAAGQRIALVGHSWGAASAYKAAAKSDAPVDLLITLDPVSVFPLGERQRPVNVRRWVNVYLDFKRADLRDSSNLTAWIGRPWGASAKADVSYDFMTDWPGTTPPGHAWCYEMFNFYARRELERLS